LMVPKDTSFTITIKIGYRLYLPVCI